MIFGLSKPDPVELERKGNFKKLIKLLNYRDDPYIRRKSAEILGKHRIKEAVDFLIKRMEDEDWQVRMKTAEALGFIGDIKATEPLIKGLSDEYWQVRCACAISLGKLKDKRATEKLIKLLDDKKREVQKVAAEAIGEIGDDTFLDKLIKALSNKHPEVKIFISDAISKIGKNNVEKILNILEITDNKGVQWGIIRAIGETKDKKSGEKLLRFLKDKDYELREVAAEALGRIGDKKALPYLEKAEKEEKVKDVLMTIKTAIGLLKNSS
ncbi:HEAT repeat domain-containing protein [bacterium]|nr:HEAT repeat domain-containing protein [bacterium]